MSKVHFYPDWISKCFYHDGNRNQLSADAIEKQKPYLSLSTDMNQVVSHSSVLFNPFLSWYELLKKEWFAGSYLIAWISMWSSWHIAKISDITDASIVPRNAISTKNKYTSAISYGSKAKVHICAFHPQYISFHEKHDYLLPSFSVHLLTLIGYEDRNIASVHARFADSDFPFQTFSGRFVQSQFRKWNKL